MQTELVGGLPGGEGVLEFALPHGVSGPDARPLGLLTRRVELYELVGDLAHALRAPPSPSASQHRQSPMNGRGLAPYVTGHLVGLVGPDEQPVAGLARVCSVRIR